jgi:Na+/proline symporter
MSAVIWTDTFQVFVIFAGLLSVIIKGLIRLGGFGPMWSLVEQGDRVEFFK